MCNNLCKIWIVYVIAHFIIKEKMFCCYFMIVWLRKNLEEKQPKPIFQTSRDLYDSFNLGILSFLIKGFYWTIMEHSDIHIPTKMFMEKLYAQWMYDKLAIFS